MDDWKYLIVIDACRFDYFEKIHEKYFKGTLTKLTLDSRHTMEWLNKTFPYYYDDMIYISANPFVNSKIEMMDQYKYKFDGKKHFFKVIDIWHTGWDESIGTVLPDTVSK